MSNVDKYQDIIDSRDVIARIEELEASETRECDKCEATGLFPPFDSGVRIFWSEIADRQCPECGGSGEVLDLDDEETQELANLKSLAEEASDSPDWEHGESLIRDSYFQEYAQDLADDIGAIDPNAGWPTNCIDWERAARELRMDYTAVDFDGVTYWIHS